MIIYLGNMLSVHGYAPTSVETVGTWLGTMYRVKRGSSFKIQFLRLMHMCWIVFWNRRKADVVLIDTYSGMSFLYGVSVAYLSKILGLGYIPILRGGNLPQRFNKSTRMAEKFIRNAKAVVVPSNYLKYEVERRGWAYPVLIPNSIDLDQYDFKARTLIQPHLLWVRSFHKLYNPLMALEVLKRLRDRGLSGARLCMIGQDKDGTMKEFQKMTRDYGLNEFVEITGKLSKSEWIRKSIDYDIFINTTNFDNTPVSVIEGMALGLPVVSTNVGGIPYLLTSSEDALLTEAGNVQQMVDCIMELMSNPDLTNYISMNARKKAESFSWSSAKLKWIKLLDLYTQRQT